MSLDIKSRVHRNLQVLSKTSQGPISQLDVKSLVLHSQPPVDVRSLLFLLSHKLLQPDPKESWDSFSNSGSKRNMEIVPQGLHYNLV